jgi:hypothetical protein
MISLLLLLLLMMLMMSTKWEPLLKELTELSER